MCEITIPSSPGWYLSNILATNDDGSALAYGAKHEIVILQVSASNPRDVQPKFIPMAHKDRIVAVAFSPSHAGDFADMLVSCSDDGAVHVWCWRTESLVMSHSGHGDSHKVVGVDWSRADPLTIVSVSDLGSLVCWDLSSNTIRRQSLGNKVTPFVVSCCPHNKELVAVGAKSGLVLVFNTKNNGHIVHRLKAHETDVVSLSWCPVKYNVFRESSDDDTMFLATGAKDRSIYLWRAGGDGRYESYIYLPSNPIATTGYRTKSNASGSASSWICVRWVEPLTLLASSLYGELLAFDLSKTTDKDGKTKPRMPRLVHGIHTRSLFSIAAPIKNPKNRVVWTYALDKHLVACRLDGHVVTDLTTIGGIVYCMASSPLDPNRIAIGTGDNKILVWNMSNDAADNVTTCWNKINSKVMAVAWHPTNESLVAFGTGEGRVGLVDVTKSTNAPRIFRQYHRRSVYSLIWAPPIVEISDKRIAYALFSVGDGDILQHNPDTPEKEPINLSSYFKACDASVKVSKSLGRTDLAWNHDGTLAAVGNDNGVLFIVDGRTFNHVHTIFAHSKLVQCTVWHPATVTSEDAQSPFATWLASASDNIQIVNVTKAGVDVVASLNTHSEKIVSLAWSPHFNGRLVSASYDYTSQVWDVSSGSVLACFDGHHSAVVCCLPSALHQDWVITGSADNTVRVWNINMFRLTKAKTKKQRLAGAMKKFAGAREATELTKAEKPEWPPTNGEIPTKHVEFNLNVDHKRKSKSMFPVTSGGMTQAKHLCLLWSYITGTESLKNMSTGNSGYLDFFGDATSMRRLVTVEREHHREQNNASHADTFSLWAGDISETIKEACKKKQLNDWLVSMAPMVCHKLWVDCCRCYAGQLAAAGDTIKAVSYLLAVHLVEEAVDLLLDAKLYREAVCLAKLRMPKNDPTVKKAVVHWAQNALSTGTLSLAAHCMLSVGANIEAVEVLSKSKDPEVLGLAAEIAIKADAEEMGLSVAMRAINVALESSNYAVARGICSSHPALEDLALWIDVAELKADWVQKGDAILAWIVGSVPEADKWLGLYENACVLCRRKVTSYSSLLKFLPNKPTSESEKKVWVYVAGQISLAAAAQMTTNNSRVVLKHLVLAMEAAYNYHIHNPSQPEFFLQLCVWISPCGPLGTLPEIPSTDIALFESFLCYMAAGVVYWLDALNSKNALPLDALNDVEPTLRRSANLLFHRDVIAYHKIDVDVKKLENAVASSKLKALVAVRYCKELEEAQLGREPQEDGDASDSKKLARLKTLRAAFENDRLVAPNPFIAFCTLRNLLESVVVKRPETQKLLDDLKLQWDTASSDDSAAATAHN